MCSQNVISQSVMEVSPIELAIESIVTRNAQLTAEITRSPAVLSSLQQVRWLLHVPQRTE